MEGPISDLVAASKLPAKSRKVGIKSTVDGIVSLAYERGVLPDELLRLLDLIVTPSHLDQASLGSLVRNLYPASRVSEDALLSVVGCLGHGKLKPSLTIQALLLRWVVLVHHTLEAPDLLSRAYGVLFNLLDTAAIRSQLCHVLALVTRRKHVQPYRIQALLALSRQTGDDPSLVGLLRVYKNYYPEIIVGSVTKGRAASFKHPDPEWRARLDEIQAARLEDRDSRASTDRNPFRVKSQFSRPRASAIPPVRTLHAQEDSITLEEIDSAEALVGNIEKIELPNQLVAVLEDPLLQKLLTLRPDEDASSRASNWITDFISDIRNGVAQHDRLAEVLTSLREYVVNTKLPHFLVPLFTELLKVWNGKDERETVLEVLTYLPITEWKDAYPLILQQLERCILDNTPDSQLTLLGFYTALLRRWAIVLLSADDLSQLPTSAVSSLEVHVSQLCLTVLQTAPTTSTHHAVLDFHDEYVKLLLNLPIRQRIGMKIPSPLTVHTLHFSQSPAVLSRLFSMLATYKRAFELDTGRRDLRLINTFNGLIMDVCNAVWRGRAFASGDAHATGCLVPAPTVAALRRYLADIDLDVDLGSALDLSHSSVFSLQAISHVRLLEDAAQDEGEAITMRHAGPVTAASLTKLANSGGLDMSWQDYRAGVLDHLDAMGFGGILELMQNTMKALMRAKT